MYIHTHIDVPIRMQIRIHLCIPLHMPMPIPIHICIHAFIPPLVPSIDKSIISPRQRRGEEPLSMRLQQCWFYKVSVLLFYCFIVSLFYCFIVLLFHCFIVSLLIRLEAHGRVTRCTAFALVCLFAIYVYLSIPAQCPLRLRWHCARLGRAVRMRMD